MVTDVGIYKLSESATVPFKGTELSACHDLCACLHHKTVKFHGSINPVVVNDFGTDKAFIRMFPGDLALVPTGLIFCIPPTHYIEFKSRSGNTLKRLLKVANQPAVIDSDYTKESFVLLHNQSMNVQIIKTGDPIAQCNVEEVKDLSFFIINDEQLKRFRDIVKTVSDRDGGLGSTNK